MRVLFPVLLLLLAFSACKNKKYCACCENAPLEAVFALQPPFGDSATTEARVYVPNIFAYGEPQLNDHFLPFTNGGVALIHTFEGRDAQKNLLFLQHDFEPNDPGFAWNGFTTGGARFEGVFDYKIVLRLIDGQEKTLTGSACAYPCGDGDFPVDQLKNCGFPTQNNGNGQFDPTYPGPQESCFEE